LQPKEGKIEGTELEKKKKKKKKKKTAREESQILSVTLPQQF